MLYKFTANNNNNIIIGLPNKNRITAGLDSLTNYTVKSFVKSVARDR